MNQGPSLPTNPSRVNAYERSLWPTDTQANKEVKSDPLTSLEDESHLTWYFLDLLFRCLNFWCMLSKCCDSCRNCLADSNFCARFFILSGNHQILGTFLFAEMEWWRLMQNVVCSLLSLCSIDRWAIYRLQWYRSLVSRPRASIWVILARCFSGVRKVG